MNDHDPPAVSYGSSDHLSVRPGDMPSPVEAYSQQPGRDGPSLIISFTPDGNAICLYSDVIPLQELGSLKVQRASTVEFVEAEQQWAVTIEGETQPRFYHRSREACLDWERGYINNQLHANTT